MIPHPPHCDGCSFRPRSQGYCPPSPITAKTKLVIWGESPGADEVMQGVGFVGRAGQALRQACRRAGLDVPSSDQPDGGEVSWRNTVACRPPGNEWPGDEVAAECMKRHRSIHDQAWGRVPVVACGANAARVLTGWRESVLATRGSWLLTPGGHPVLFTLHPSYIVRGEGDATQDKFRPVLALDLHKALLNRGVIYPKIRFGSAGNMLTAFDGAQPKAVSVDIEGMDEPTLVGVSWDGIETWASWWDASTREAMKKIFESPSTKIFHNAIFDLTQLEKYGLPVPERWVDTIVLAKNFDPEMPKGLQFQTLVHVPESTAWKGLVDHEKLQGCSPENSRYRELHARWRGLRRQSVPRDWKGWYVFYHGLDLAWTRRLAAEMGQHPHEMGVYERFDMPIQKILLRMGQRGLPMDVEERERFRVEFLEKERAAGEVLQRAGEKILRKRALVEALALRKLLAQRRAERREGDRKFSRAAELSKVRTRLKARHATLEKGFNVDSSAQRVALLVEEFGVTLPISRKTHSVTTDDTALEGLLEKLERGTLKYRKGVDAGQLAEVLTALVEGKKYATLRRNFLREAE